MNNDYKDFYIAVLVIIIALTVGTVLYIKHKTGLSFPTIRETAGLLGLVLFFTVLGAYNGMIRWRHWNWVGGAIILALTPAFQEWGAEQVIYNEFGFQRVVEAKWYASRLYILISAGLFAGSKYFIVWLWDLAAGRP